jgi:trehalose-phosphatase
MAAARQDPETPGHAFLSYVREDEAKVKQLQRVLERAGIDVWRDRSNLWPGQDWRAEIRKAITDDALVFIACFSSDSLARSKTYQNEELVLAIDQLRLRQPEQPWLIPVRFDDCEIPERDLGGGRSLSSLQWADLSDDTFDEGAARLVIAIRRILEPTTPSRAPAWSQRHRLTNTSQAPTTSQKQFTTSRPTALEALAEDPTASGLILDFDGVLAPIEADLTTSAIPDPVQAILRRLAGRLGLLAIVSGRPVEYLADHVRIPGVPLLGSFGMEQLRNGRRHVDPEAERQLRLLRIAARALMARLATFPDVFVEIRAASVVVHWRKVPDPAIAAAEIKRIMAGIAAETGMQLRSGSFAEELYLSAGTRGKGSTIIPLLLDVEPLTAFAYAGDDLGDIAALHATRELGGYALVVEYEYETSSELLRLADQTFTGTEGFAMWLAKLADAIGALRNLPICARVIIEL